MDNICLGRPLKAEGGHNKGDSEFLCQQSDAPRVLAIGKLLYIHKQCKPNLVAGGRLQSREGPRILPLPMLQNEIRRRMKSTLLRGAKYDAR